jgi:uncharacterized membrane protein
MTASRRCRKPSFSQLLQLLPLTTIAVLCFAASLPAQTHGFTTINAPDAGTSFNQGTTATIINQSGAIAGFYADDKYAYHGFVRSAQGVITEFDAPGLTNTQVFGMNNSGQIVGYGLHQFSGRGEYLGFLRAPNGSISGFSAPGALATMPAAINDSGEIAGTYYTVADVYHGFIALNRGGAFTYTVFDEPNATHQPGFGTHANGINAQGVVIGYYEDATVGAIHGFTRDRSGNFASFDAPGAGTGQGYGTIPFAINLNGEIVGYYSDSNLGLHGFYRDALGNITDFDPPGSTSQTFAYSINDKGDVVGYWADSHQVYHGFLRDPSGSITTFSAPVKNNATLLLNINNARQMTGFYYDLNGVLHGFLWQVSLGSSQ